MTSFVCICRGAGLAVVVAVGPGLSACANIPNPQEARLVSSGTPGSQQDFIVNVGDRVLFVVDSSELTPQARSTLDKQAQCLQTYNQYNFTIEGHADVRGTREYNFALGAWRAHRVRDYLATRRRRQSHAYDFVRQGTASRGLQ